jgi:hypothetical protein
MYMCACVKGFIYSVYGKKWNESPSPCGLGPVAISSVESVGPLGEGGSKKKKKTYSTGYSMVVTDPTTNTFR